MNLKMDKVKATKVLGAAGLVALVAVTYLVVFMPRVSQVSDLNDQSTTSIAQNDATSLSIKSLQKKKDDLPKEQTEAAALALRVPSTAAQQVMFSAIKDAAVRAGMNESSVSSLTPSVPSSSGGAAGAAISLTPSTPTVGAIASMSLNLTVGTDYETALRFIKELEQMPRGYLISTIGLSPADAKNLQGKYVLSLTGSMFVIRSPQDPTVPIPVPQGAAGAPVAPVVPGAGG